MWVVVKMGGAVVQFRNFWYSGGIGEGAKNYHSRFLKEATIN